MKKIGMKGLGMDKLMGSLIGKRVNVIGGFGEMKGHEPPQKYAYLSDGSKITLIGKDKGLIVGGDAK